MNVLITSASRKVSLVRAFRQALEEEGGGRVLAVDVDPRSPALYLADRGFLVPRSDDPAFVPFLRELCATERVGLIVPTRDEELPLFAARRTELAAGGARVLVPPLEAVRTCQDKLRFAEFCRDRGFDAPSLLDGSRPTSIEGWPVFVKPRFGKGSAGAGAVRSADELARALAALPAAIVQEHVAAAEYTVDLFRDFEGRTISVVPRERIAMFGGESFVGRTRSHPGLISESIRLAEALGLDGHVTIQAFLDGARVRFIEVNPRYGGGAHLGFAAGASTPRFAVRLALGRPVEPCVGRFRDGLVMLRYTEDLFLADEALLRGRS